jgi:hypothetical protein
VIKTAKICQSPCYVDGRRYSNGQSWLCADRCNRCRCLNGRVVKTTKYCPKRCFYSGKYYSSGQSWTCSDRCNTCRCINGRVTITKKHCPKRCFEGGRYRSNGQSWVENTTPMGSLGHVLIAAIDDSRCVNGRIMKTCSDRCNKCRCVNGRVIKTKKHCPKRC